MTKPRAVTVINFWRDGSQNILTFLKIYISGVHDFPSLIVTICKLTESHMIWFPLAFVQRS